MSSRLTLAAVLLALSACATGQSAGPAMTRGTVPRDARGDAVLGAIAPAPPPPAPVPFPAAPIASPPPGATVR